MVYSQVIFQGMSSIVYRACLGENRAMEEGMEKERETMLDNIAEIQQALKLLNYEIVGFDCPPGEPLTVKMAYRFQPQSDGHTQ